MIGIGFYIEVLSLLCGIIGLLYIYGTMNLVNQRMRYGWRFIFIAYIFFIIAKGMRAIEYTKMIDFTIYKTIPGLLFIIFSTIGVIYFSKETMHILKKINRKK